MFVIDSNILISALIKDSTTRKIIIESGMSFYYPEISLSEIFNYEKDIMKKGGYNKNTLISILDRLLQHINLVPLEIFSNKLNEAKKIMGNIDINDTIFIATALALDNAVIWSDDKDFDRQKRIKVTKTKDMIKLFKKNNQANKPKNL